jgi:ketosteroid isomerase-like protein
MKKVLLFILTCCLIEASGQDTKKEINDQVWKPFIKAFNDRDTKAFMAVHSKDLIRSSRDSKEVLSWDEYNKQMSQWDQQELSAKSKRQLELRFTERLTSKDQDQAIDVGVYKTTNIRSDGTSRSFYGRFHVVLRKENGTWRILVDTDSSEGNSIGEKQFLAAASME